MNRKTLFDFAVIAALGIGAVAGTVAVADTPKPSAAQQEMKLPAGWTPEDMQACAAAATPGEMHKRLAGEAGVWKGTTSMWMFGSEQAMTSETTSTVTPIMDGRYIKVEMTGGGMPGTGPYSGLGLYGFDNVSQRFGCTWIDNWGTGMMKGTGELSSDGKTTTWQFNHHCAITKKPVVIRQVETITGGDTKTLEMFAPDPKSGKEFRMMRIELKKQKA